MSMKESSLRKRVGEEWGLRDSLMNQFTQEYMIRISEFLKKRREEVNVYPESNRVFNALMSTDFSDVKVVILGQDPYHTPDVADGLAFSSNLKGYKPPSLKNIFKE